MSTKQHTCNFKIVTPKADHTHQSESILSRIIAQNAIATQLVLYLASHVGCKGPTCSPLACRSFALASIRAPMIWMVGAERVSRTTIILSKPTRHISVALWRERTRSLCTLVKRAILSCKREHEKKILHEARSWDMQHFLGSWGEAEASLWHRKYMRVRVRIAHPPTLVSALTGTSHRHAMKSTVNPYVESTFTLTGE